MALETLTPLELAQAHLALERVRRAQAELAAEDARWEAMRLQLSLAHGLTPADRLDIDTGVITRAPPPSPPPDT